MLKWVLTTTAGRLLAGTVGLAVVYLAIAQPDWGTEAVRRIAEPVLQRFGVGVVPAIIWVLGFAALLYYRPKLLLRRWRLVLGSAGLVVMLQGVLAYFEGFLPLVGYSGLGGTFGQALRGQGSSLSYLRVGGLGLLSLWVMLPQPLGTLVALRLSRSLGYLVRGVLWVLSRPMALLSRRRRDREGVGGSGLELSDQVWRHLRPGRLLRKAEEKRRGSPTPKELSLSKSQNSPLEQKKSLALPAPEPDGDLAVRRGAVAAKAEADWELPPLDLLRAPAIGAEIDEDHLATARLIEQTLAEHQVEVQVLEIKPGPTVTLFGLVPGWVRRGKGGPAGEDGSPSDSRDDAEGDRAVFRSRVKVDSVVARERDLALALAAPSLRIQAPVPGESIIGVEVPNRHPATVPIRAVLESEAYERLLERNGLPVALGQASAGESVAIDLVTMPHLLIAGATGSGKSVCLNSIIASLVMHQQPSKVRLLLVDPKRVELTPYNGIPHLATPVAVEPEQVVRLLKGAIQEMLHRYRLLEEVGVRNIQSYNYNAKVLEPLPYLVICIDELADLMMASSYEVEQSICRLAQLGRATGIHLVVATQRPSVDVVTGLIKANFPTRISFAVASQVDSRTILDMAGAERLLGRGDMLFLSRESAKPRRVQGVFISEEETEQLAGYWRRAQGGHVPAFPLEEMGRSVEVKAMETQFADHDDDQDSLYGRAMELAQRYRQVSTSLLQRRLRIGYPRAARLMDLLEDEGVIGHSSEPGKAREVLSPPSEPPLAGTGLS